MCESVCERKSCENNRSGSSSAVHAISSGTSSSAASSETESEVEVAAVVAVVLLADELLCSRVAQVN